MHLSDAVVGTRCTETHAYGISHIDRTAMPPCRFVTVDAIPAKAAGSSPIREPEVNGSEPGDKHEHVSPTFTSDLEAIQTLPNASEFSTTSGGEPHKLAQLKYSNELLKYSNKPLQKFINEPIDQSSLVTREDTDIKYSSKVDHVYEEVNAPECDIMDYYEKYSPTTAKTLINTLFLPRQKICKQCASSHDSPVYSDHLIYGKKALHAREIRLIQQDDALYFKYCPEDGGGTTLFSQYDNIQHCLVVYNYTKTDASGIFSAYGPPRDVFDLKTALKPNILLVSRSAKDTANTELYHRCASNLYARISKSGVAPTAFRVDHNKILSSIKHVGYDTDLQNWINYRNDVFRSQGLKQDDAAIDYRANRSSLLLLEPLLLMPELTSPRYRQGKNRIAQSEHMKLAKIVAAYTLSFFILASVTFYIVYFT